MVVGVWKRRKVVGVWQRRMAREVWESVWMEYDCACLYDNKTIGKIKIRGVWMEYDCVCLYDNKTIDKFCFSETRR
jgi:hypothetical protein